MKTKLTCMFTASLISIIIVLSAISSAQAISANNTTGGGQTTSLDGNNISTTGGMQADAAGVAAQYDYRDDTDSYVIEHEGHDRQVLVYAPPSVRESLCAAPVVFMLHGSSGTGEKFWDMSGWKEKAREEGFIAVFPTSQAYLICEDGKDEKHITKWGGSGLQDKLCGTDQIVADDHAFIRRVVDLVKRDYPADARRFYATGFSNGGAFVGELLADESDLFAACASSGVLPTLGTPAQPIPFYMGVGDEDRVAIPHSLLPDGVNRLPVSEQALSIPYVDNKITHNLGILGLSHNHRTLTKPKFFLASNKRDLSEQIATDREFHFQIFKGLGHKYPNGKNHDLKMADILWSFFSRFPTYHDETDTYLLEHEGHDRQVLVYAPSSVREGQCTVPVVFMLHGSSGTGEKFWNMSGWKEKAREEGFIAVFPTSQAYRVCEDGKNEKYSTKWGGSGLQDKLCGTDQIVADDHAFIRRVVDLVKRDYSADAQRFYVTGFSNGADFVSELAVEDSDLFAAAAANGWIANLVKEHLSAPLSPIPFYVGVGDVDRKAVPPEFLPSGTSRLPVSEQALSIPLLNERIEDNLGFLRLFSDHRSVTEPEYFLATYKTDDQSGLETTDREFRFQIFKDLGHSYPNGTNYDLKMTDILWPFFSRFLR